MIGFVFPGLVACDRLGLSVGFVLDGDGLASERRHWVRLARSVQGVGFVWRRDQPGRIDLAIVPGARPVV